MRKKQKQFPFTFILILTFFIGLSLLLYPSIANYVNQLNGSKIIGEYSEAVSKLSEEDYRRLWQEAEEYNKTILQRQNGYMLDESQKKQYSQLLNISNNGVMGYIEIPSIGVNLPVFHGTDDNTLQVAAGHLDWTSLPVGGAGTHCVLSGHRGLPSAKLFTHLDKLALGDIFMLRVLNEVLTYEVDQILTVEPGNVQPLRIVPGEDYCTLVTCTPYGINTHRLLVRGHRVDTVEGMDMMRVTADAVEIEPLLVAPVLALPLLLCMLIIVMVHGRKRKGTGRNKHE